MTAPQNGEPLLKQIFLAGEGTNELGSWSREPEYRSPSVQGVLETLLRKTKESGWIIKDAICWKSIRKFKAGDHQSAEERNILGVCNKAKEKGCSIIAFSRDTDGDAQRKIDLENGMKKAHEFFGSDLGIVGGIAIPCIEGWILAILGELRTEQYSKSKAITTLIAKGIPKKCTEKMVARIAIADLDKISEDADGLRQWLRAAKKHLADD